MNLPRLFLHRRDDPGVAMPRIQGTEAGDEIQEQITVNVLDHRSLRALDDDGIRAHPEAEGSAAFRLPETFKFLASFRAGVGNHKFRRFQEKPSS